MLYAFAAAIAAKADSVGDDILARSGLGQAPAGRIEVIICPNADEYIAATSKAEDEYEAWMVGSSNFTARRIALLSPCAAAQHTPAELERVFVHEAVHMLFDPCIPGENAPPQCAEGIALYYAGQIEAQYICADSCPATAELTYEAAFADNGGNDYAGVYARYYIKRFGMPNFLNFMPGMLPQPQLYIPDLKRQPCRMLWPYRA